MIRSITAVLFIFAYLFFGEAELNAGTIDQNLHRNGQLSPSESMQIESSAIEQNRFKSSLYVSPKPAIRNLKNDPNQYILVDVRGKEFFKKARIPGSINIPLYSLKTKTFLKDKSIILVSESVANAQLQRTCAKLNASNFNARILFGGIKLWQEVGGQVTGNFFYLNSLKTITAADYYSSIGFSCWEVVDASAAVDEKAGEFFPEAVSVPFVDGNNSFAKALQKANITKKRDRFSSVLVINKNGTHYAKISDAVQLARLSNVYYLEGGLKGYQRFKQKLALMHNHKKGEKISQKKCAVCP